jgi:hypothetical protein
MENYDLLLPKLMEAKAGGLISDFEPDLFGGYVKVVNPSDALRGSGALFPVYFTRGEAVTRPPVSTARIGDRSASIAIDLSLYSSYFDISTGIPNAHIKGTLKSPSGEVLGVINDYADSSGDLYGPWDGYSASNVPGYKVRFKVYDASEVYVGTYYTTVPRILFKTVDKAAGKITGTAPAGLDFWVYLSHRNLNSTGDWYHESLYGTVSSTGKWSTDFAISLRGGDYLFIQVYKTSVFSFSRTFYIPRLGCQLQTNYCFNNTFPNKPATMTVTHGGTTYTISGKTDHLGYLYGYLFNSAGDPVLITSGDKITGTDAATERVPKLTQIVNRAADTVTGTAPPNKWLSVSINIRDLDITDYDWVKSTSVGTYAASFIVDIPGKGTLESDIRYTNPNTGNLWYFYKMIP